MNYQISRNGQMYGPYTLEDLQRYVASGNVLGTDLAKSESMAEWLPVSQILSGASAPGAASVLPSAEYAPVNESAGGPSYGAGTAAYDTGAANVSGFPDAPNLHWALVLLFAFLTCGLFMVIWNFIICAWLRRVQPNANAIFLYSAAYGLLIFRIVLAIPLGIRAAMLSTGDFQTHLGTTILLSFLGLGVWVLRLIARFSERASLEEHFNGPEPMGLRVDGVMTFFFGGLYFQSKLNDINAAKTSGQFGAMRRY